VCACVRVCVSAFCFTLLLFLAVSILPVTALYAVHTDTGCLVKSQACSLANTRNASHQEGAAESAPLHTVKQFLSVIQKNLRNFLDLLTDNTALTPQTPWLLYTPHSSPARNYNILIQNVPCGV